MLMIVFFSGCIKDDVVRPGMVSINPSDNVTGVARNTVVEFTFSEEMDPLTINILTFTLMKGAELVPGLVTYAGTKATFTPLENLLSATLYKATITTGAKSKAGNSIANNIGWSFTTGGSSAALSPVALGSAVNYVVLAKTAITNSPTSAVTGNMGLSPAATSYITGLTLTNATGYATSVQVVGQVFAADMADPTPNTLTTAVSNMTTAYNDAAGRTSPDFTEYGAGDIGGKTLKAGLYKWSNTVILPTSITLSGTETDVWIFQVAGNLTVSPAVNVILTGGALAKNIFWQVAGQVTLGTTSHFEGVILSMTGITFQTGASLNGRALAQTAVVLDSNSVTRPQL